MVADSLAHGPGTGSARPYKRERSVAIKAAHAAGAAIREIYGQALEVSFKSGDDPLTIADRTADRLILERLRAEFPDDGWFSEEDSQAPTVDPTARTWVVDPLDGTREFVAGIPEFAVSIALIEAGRPVVAVVYNPVADLLMAATLGGGVSGGPRPETIQHATDLHEAVVLASRSETSRGRWDLYAGRFRIVPTGSVAFKLGMVAFGMADATISLAPKHGWDITAGVLLVQEAGGRVCDLDGGPIDLSRPGALLQGLIASQPDVFPDVLRTVRAVEGARAEADARAPGPAEVAAISLAGAVAAPLDVAVAPVQAESPGSILADSAADLASGQPELTATGPVGGPEAPASLLRQPDPVAWPRSEWDGVAPMPTSDRSAIADGGAGGTAVVTPRSAAPRITPAERTAPFVVASPSTYPPDGSRPLIRTAVIYTLILSIGVLLGFIVADLTRESRRGATGAPSGTTAVGALAALPSTGLGGPSPLASVEPSPTVAVPAGPVIVAPVATLDEPLTANGIEVLLRWQAPTDGSTPSRYELRMARDAGDPQAVELAKETSRRARVALTADHEYTVWLRARDVDGTWGPPTEAALRLSRVEESDPAVRASKGWKVAKHPDYTGAGARYSNAGGAELSLAFDGTAAAIVGPRGPGRGRADVFVDGERVGRFDALGSSYDPVHLLFSVDGLTSGPHVLTVRVDGTQGRPTVAVDSFLVLGQP